MSRVLYKERINTLRSYRVYIKGHCHYESRPIHSQAKSQISRYQGYAWEAELNEDGSMNDLSIEHPREYDH